jgi:sugar lactone lactonase YvrE
MAPGIGVQRFTPDQTFFRDSIARGRWGGALPLAPGDVANRNLNMVRRHPDGTCDMIALEAAGKFYIDLGGSGARDMRSGKP